MKSPMTGARRRWLAGVAVVTLLATAGCGEDTKVGDESLLNFEEQVGERLGETTTTTVPPTTATTAAGTAATGPAGPAPTATTAHTRATAPAQAPATTATTAAAPEIPVVEILIFDDNAPAAIEPQYARQFVGGVIRWINKDTQVRGVRATTTRFPCESIPPGGSCDYTPRAAGIFDYGDSTRPYVTATLEVLPTE